jgi:hypothetical protein
MLSTISIRNSSTFSDELSELAELIDVDCELLDEELLDADDRLELLDWLDDGELEE